MKTLTNESKMRFFTQHVYCCQVQWQRIDDNSTEISNLTIQDISFLATRTNSALIKTPLQKISDEHAIEVAKLEEWVSHKKELVVIALDTVLRSGKLSYAAYQFLRSHNYATPYL
jgi:spore coat protein CotH